MWNDQELPLPPARPSMANQAKPPVLRPIPPPRSVAIARMMWVSSFALGGAAILIAFLPVSGVKSKVSELLGNLTPGRDADTITLFADLIYWTALVGLSAVIATEAILLAMVLNRRGGARWVQLPVLILHAGGMLLWLAYVASGQWGAPIALLLVCAFAIACLGWLFCLLPSAFRWFRVKDRVPVTAQ